MNGRDQGDAKIPETALRDIHDAGYVPAIEDGVQTVMISFSSWKGVKMTGNQGLLTDVLKERMNFDGFTVGDWNGARPGRRLHQRQLPAGAHRRARHVHGAGYLARPVREPASSR